MPSARAHLVFLVAPLLAVTLMGLATPALAAGAMALSSVSVVANSLRLRRYDEEAKDPQAQTPDFDHYLRHVPVCRK